MMTLKKIAAYGLAMALSLPIFAQQKKPNIIVIMADDMGFSDLGCYGGEVKTPRIDELASKGLRFKQFYNAARCCPTRASLMTGLYPHQAGMGWMAAADMGRPAYSGNLNMSSVTIAEVLKDAGYGTYMTGKWHLTNERKIDGNVKDNWPKQRGFDHYFGIIPGGANYYTPELYSNNSRYPAPKDFYLTNAISDTSVKYIEQHFQQQADRPMFMYVAYTAPHWPLHALQKDIDKYKAQYQQGWDTLRSVRFAKQQKIGLFNQQLKMTDRDPKIPAWEELAPAKKEEMAMRMAIYAAQIDIMDQGIGRIIDKLSATGQLDNTLIFFLSDNGACAEFISSGPSKAVDGKENTFESYRINWANLSSTPFKEYKHYTYEGGIATPLVVHWPAGIKPDLQNSFANGYGHLTDIMATCVDVAKAQYPKAYKGHVISPMEGQSMRKAFSGAALQRGKVFWEHEANIAFRDGDWKLVASTAENAEFDPKNLQLFDLRKDPAELNDRAKAEPERLKKMYGEWEKWAKRLEVLPMSTKGYGARMEAYRRELNGDFDDLLGGWNIHKTEAVEATIVIDTNAVLTGKNAVKVHMLKPGDKPAGLFMAWPFHAKKNEQFSLTLNGKADQTSTVWIRIEKAGGDFSKVIDQPVQLSNNNQSIRFSSSQIPSEGNYRIGLYFGKMAADANVWIDDVKLVQER